jgi:hypothetical protein
MSNEAYENSEDRHGNYDHIIANIFLEKSMEEALIKVGSPGIIESYKKLQRMFYALPPEVIEDLKNLTVREIKDKYGLEGEKINSEFLVTSLYQKTVEGK